MAENWTSGHTYLKHHHQYTHKEWGNRQQEIQRNRLHVRYLNAPNHGGRSESLASFYQRHHSKEIDNKEIFYLRSQLKRVESQWQEDKNVWKKERLRLSNELNLQRNSNNKKINSIIEAVRLANIHFSGDVISTNPVWFLEQVEAMINGEVTGDMAFKRVFKAALKGRAARWVKLIDTGSYNQLRLHFIERYWSKDIQSEVNAWLICGVFEGEDCKENYFLKWARHAKYLDVVLSDEAIIHKLKWHFSDRIIDKIEVSKPQTIWQMAQLLSREDGFFLINRNIYEARGKEKILENHKPKGSKEKTAFMHGIKIRLDKRKVTHEPETKVLIVDLDCKEKSNDKRSELLHIGEGKTQLTHSIDGSVNLLRSMSIEHRSNSKEGRYKKNKQQRSMTNELVGDHSRISRNNTLEIRKLYPNEMSDGKVIKKELNRRPLINNNYSKYETNHKGARQMVQNIKTIIKKNFNQEKHVKYPVNSRSIKTKKLKNWWEKKKIKCKIKKKIFFLNLISLILFHFGKM